MRESQQSFFGLWLVIRIFEEFQQPAIQTKIVQHFGGFFHKIKVRQLIGRKDSIQTLIRTSTLQRLNTEISKQIFPEKEYRGLNPNFHIHASVSNLYIHTIGLPILL